MSGSNASLKTKAADLLLRAQALPRQEFDRVLALVHQTGERAEEVMIEHEIVSEADLLKALSAIYRTHFVSTEKLSRADIPRATVQMIPQRVAETLGVFPVLFDRQTHLLSVVTADPDNAAVLADIKLVSGAAEVKAFVARPAAIRAAIRKHHTGDQRAFEALERVNLEYDFGQQVMPDGRVMSGKESFRMNAALDVGHQTNSMMVPGTRVPDSSAPVSRHAVPPAHNARRQVDEEEDAFAAPPPVRPVRMPEPDPGARMSRRVAPMSLEPPPLPPVMSKRAGPIPMPTPVDPDLASHMSKRAAPPKSLSAPPAPISGLGGAGPSLRVPRAAPAVAWNIQTSISPAAIVSVPAPPIPSAPPAAPVRKPAPSPSPRLESDPPASELARQNVLQHDTTIELLTVMVSLLENSRQELRGHSSQVARLLGRVAERMNLDRAETQALVVAGHIHDLGKMGQFHLTALNCAEYEGHRVAAQKAYTTPLRLLEAVRLTPSIKSAVFHMYERVDGKGFPDKLGAKDIPLGARLLAVADTYSDLTQNPRNPFRKVLGPAEAMNVLTKHKGTIFDESILDLFSALVLGEDIRAKLLASRYRVLLVDADPEEATVLELRMVEQGFDVKTARSAEIARKLASAEGADFDLVVCELQLPDADGLAFLADARKEAWGRDIPWVVHTHKQGRAEANRAFELGAMDFVGKPVQADVLVAKLKAMLDQWSTGRGAKGVNGSLREMGLPDIVQVLFHGRKTGKLNLRSGGKNGEIHFLEGNIANAFLGEVSGKEAFYALLRFAEGDFALDPSFTPPKRVISDSSESLLLEGMRRMDEDSI